MHENGVFTLGHGVRPSLELATTLREAGVRTLVDVRRFPTSRRNPQFNQGPLRETLEAAGVDYRHAVELGGRRSGEPGAGALRLHQSRRLPELRRADGHLRVPGGLARELDRPMPCFMCAETPWQKCHR